jgi:hypothetical protein
VERIGAGRSRALQTVRSLPATTVPSDLGREAATPSAECSTHSSSPRPLTAHDTPIHPPAAVAAGCGGAGAGGGSSSDAEGVDRALRPGRTPDVGRSDRPEPEKEVRDCPGAVALTAARGALPCRPSVGRVTCVRVGGNMARTTTGGRALSADAAAAAGSRTCRVQ